MSIWTRGAGDPLVFKVPARPDLPDLDASRILKLSRREANDLATGIPEIAGVFEDRTIRWNRLAGRRVEGCCLLTGKPMAIPSLCVLLGEGAPFGVAREGLTTSVGAAIWTTQQGAAQRALLELVERDAAACWWYNRQPCPRIGLDEAHHIANLDDALSRWLSERERRTAFVILPTDLPVHAIAAISSDPAGDDPALGLGAALQATHALTAAILEMLMREISNGHIDMHGKAASSRDVTTVPNGYRWSKSTNINRSTYLSGTPATLLDLRKLERSHSFDHLLARLADKNIDVWSIDCTRPEIGLPCTKVISGQLHNGRHGLAPGRLYTLPVELGLRRTPLVEARLNPERMPV